MANGFVQTMADARVDAQSLSEFVFKPVGFKVARRLAPPIDTLQFYINRFDATKATADAYIATIPGIVNDAINNTAVEGGVLADTFVTVTANAAGTVVRTQGEKNKERISFKDFGASLTNPDNTTHIKNALNYAIANNAVIEDYSGDTYTFLSDITIAGAGKKLALKGNCTLASPTSYITLTGSIAEVGNITVAANENEVNLNISSAAGLIKGDILAIQNTRAKSFCDVRDYYYDGEMAVVDSVTGDVVTLQSGLETSYPSGVEDKVFKISPIFLDIDGVTFDCNGFAGLRIQMAAYSKFKLNAYNKLNLGVASYGIVFDRCYDSTMEKGSRAIKEGVGSTGTDYGVAISNCSDMKIEPDYAFGGRHGVAMGGGDVMGAVPNRRCYVEKATIESIKTVGIHTADIHGNSADCHYKDCTIAGMVGLGGKRCYSIDNKITLMEEEVRSPILITEIAGTLGSIGDTIINSGSATAILALASSATAALNTRPYSFELRDVTIIKTKITMVMNAVVTNTTPSKFIVDGFEFLGNYSTLTRLLGYSEAGTVSKPTYVQITNPRNSISDTLPIITGDGNLAGVTKHVYSSSGSNTNGSWTKYSDGTMVCRHRVTGTLAFTTAILGGFKTDNLTWTYPKPFIAAPSITAIAFDNSAFSVRGALSTAAAAQVYAVNPATIASAGVNLDVVATGRWLY